jgi:dipeptidase E
VRLYLSSFRIGNRPEELLRLLGSGRRTALILNADDYKSPEDRAAGGEREFAELSGIGLDPFELDLRKFFGRTEELRDVLSTVDLIYARGGSAFVLRRAFAHCGADQVIPDLLAKDAVVYGGYSAGPCMLIPSLRGFDGAVDLPDFTPDGYPAGPPIWDGLGVLPFAIAPHYRSDHPESNEIERSVAYFIENHEPFIALRDGQAIVVDGDTRYVVE